ncbi:hypothetical protein M3Y99_01544400 [Aphelenchoides fujianensis]|nr:hypothetical protein M3Y99_01544400 [Aphelenchoides fujianensis]
MNQQELRVAGQLKGPFMTLFKCAECGVAFADENELNGHNKQVHPALRYECFKCDARFTLPSLRNRHESKKHGFERDKAYKKMKKHPEVGQTAMAQGHGVPVQESSNRLRPSPTSNYVPMDPVHQVAAPAAEILPNDQPLELSPSTLWRNSNPRPAGHRARRRLRF